MKRCLMNEGGTFAGEIQLTSGESGFCINHIHCFSPDDKWIVFDTRNDDSQIIQTGTIGIVAVETGQVKEIYRTENQTEFGPGVGAATFLPQGEKILFLHGLRNANKVNPYGFTRRTGVAVDIRDPFVPIFMDARNITFPYTRGALRGGTHAHSTSKDGKWISFTYNDYILEQLSKDDESIKDLRTVGVMMPGAVWVEVEDGCENHSGQMFSAIVTEVTENPKWGSDEIEKAFDETWVGSYGYQREDGSQQARAIAFQGHVRDEDGNSKTEIFIVDLPESIKEAVPNKPIEGTRTTRPNIPAGVCQRRITFLKFGVQGPRHWLRSKHDGSLIAFLSQDDQGFIQIFGVSPNSGALTQITNHAFSIQSPFSFSPNDQYIAYVADNSIYRTDLIKKETTKLSIRFSDLDRPVGAVVWSNNGTIIAYNRYVKEGSDRFLHIFLLKDFD